jgi:hypothetical protein
MLGASTDNEVRDGAESDTVFLISVVNAKATFVKDAAGQVAGIVIHTGGRDLRAKKTK